MEQFDDILRTLITETNKFENRIGTTRDEHKMLAVKKLMPESLLDFRLRGTTLKYEELLIPLENIMIDKVSTVPTTRQKKIDTSAPQEIGMVAKDDSDSSREEGDQRVTDIALQASYKGTGRGHWRAGKGPSWNT